MSNQESERKTEALGSDVERVVRRAIYQALDENHKRRVGYSASQAWLNNSMKHFESNPLWGRVLEILRESDV